MIKLKAFSLRLVFVLAFALTLRLAKSLTSFRSLISERMEMQAVLLAYKYIICRSVNYVNTFFKNFKKIF